MVIQRYLIVVPVSIFQVADGGEEGIFCAHFLILLIYSWLSWALVVARRISAIASVLSLRVRGTNSYSRQLSLPQGVWGLSSLVVEVWSLSHAQLLNPMAVACQTPLFMGFSR